MPESSLSRIAWEQPFPRKGTDPLDARPCRSVLRPHSTPERGTKRCWAEYNSNGRFYAESNKRLGMTPTEFKAGGGGATIRFAAGECSLGSILVAASDSGICSIA